LDKRIQKDFQIEPQANNSIVLWVKGIPVEVYSDRKDLIIIIPEEMELIQTSNGIRLKRKKNGE